MKTIIITTILFLLTIQNTSNEPPSKVLMGLKKEFPTASNIKWIEIENKYEGTYVFNGKAQKYVVDLDNYWKAEFVLGGRRTSATFDLEGHWIYAQQEITIEDIGIEEVKAAISKDFSECKIISIKLNNWAGHGTTYDVEGICGTEKKNLSYDIRGWPWPPKKS